MEVKKFISDEENEILSLLETLSLQDITVPYNRDGNTLTMAKGETILYDCMDLSSLYFDVLSNLYSYRNKKYSKGIYCFLQSSQCIEKAKNYYEYLKEEINCIEKQYLDTIDVSLKESYDMFMKFSKHNLDRYKNYFIGLTEFELLHGDLFSGNVLQYNNRNVLIDFEYIRFGPFIAELAFALCWDIISDFESCWTINQLYDKTESLLINKIITIEEKNIILNFYIPLYASLAMLFASAGKYNNSDIIKKGVKKFVMQYYFREGTDI